ncbi:hydroxylamine reductase [Pseudothermotoga thermarum]|uniref:Hydroxylamine reductase n=1 Tax=Pseudothermotoga thermarum DSM 5069 TaxID=688269 RepID=F7YTX5_9THEM|nr:hydroxylamine reductase [Pseudothermotoga thermarum]AEH51426.1 hybrid cluster protein [Pseudothermotoga thermarum DSM 5069]
MSMFCYQCQEALNNVACSLKAGVCGKTDETAKLQDVLVYVTKAIAWLNKLAREQKINEEKTNKFLLESLFSTVTNVNFDPHYFVGKIKEGLTIRDSLKSKLKVEAKEFADFLTWTGQSKEDFLKKAEEVGILSEPNEDIRSLKELITYGIKGMAAYAYHAYVLGFKDEEIYKFMEEALSQTLRKDITTDELISLVMETGKYAVKTMELLDKANTSRYGNPQMTKVNIGVRNRPGILVSGHDLRDLEMLLEQSKDAGIDVYTHGEMLPAHYYPFFKKYPHFVGNYGNSWWKQSEEFEKFNGPILMTTNCLVPPKDSYKDRLYTTNMVAFPGVKHIPEKEDGTKDFSLIIEHAKRCPPPTPIEEGFIIGGFAHNQALALADKIVEAVKTGAIKKFVVMAGCDGRFPVRKYYTEFAKALPKDTVILTAGCAKYRYNKLNLGDINGIPRVLDAGQCNDSYSLALIALKLKEIFNLKDINELPIVYNIAWYEQKAVTVLLALLYLGVKNIHLGPTLPAFLSKNVAKLLVEKFNIGTISTVEQDIKSWIG